MAQYVKQSSLNNTQNFNLQVPIMATPCHTNTTLSKFDPYDHLNLKLNPDGTVTRLLNMPTATPNPDPNSGQPVVSKDITLDPSKETSIRIFVPTKFSFKEETQNTRLPIVLYFHGCNWAQNRANNFSLHLSRSYAACTIPAILLLVDYRLAPENKLPAPYDDAIDALLWLKKQAIDLNGEPWLRDYGDFSRCFLKGSGCGANIVFNAALRALDVDLGPIKIAGLIMNQPLFGGKHRTESEIIHATDQLLPLPVLDLIWELALPKGTDRDHRYCNPMADVPQQNKLSSLPKCMVYGFGMDPLIDRQQDFVKMLVDHGVRVEAQFDEVGFHRIELVDPKRAITISNMVKGFING